MLRGPEWSQAFIAAVGAFFPVFCVLRKAPGTIHYATAVCFRRTQQLLRVELTFPDGLFHGLLQPALVLLVKVFAKAAEAELLAGEAAEIIGGQNGSGYCQRMVSAQQVAGDHIAGPYGGHRRKRGNGGGLEPLLGCGRKKHFVERPEFQRDGERKHDQNQQGTPPDQSPKPVEAQRKQQKKKEELQVGKNPEPARPAGKDQNAARGRLYAHHPAQPVLNDLRSTGPRRRAQIAQQGNVLKHLDLTAFENY